MRWWYELKSIMRKLNRRHAEQEAEEEIRTHLELETREKIEAGLSLGRCALCGAAGIRQRCDS